ncbi:SPOR domain-containing protein [Thioclava sp. A2]|uniref:SPOR domain-containing protein n=1 Tax=Thioclava sp. FCG-A2 TaxID=3080562 RepID=UPI002952C379|nr:SPOR domain-containing protein [Thioclava sp. A2]MDV7269532.1 SPOR domain-containing protein [Thioclava sp. A2]
MASINYRTGGGYGYEGASAPHQHFGHPQYAEQAPHGAPPVPMQRWINLAGAATSVALMLGLVVWGYKLAVRDISGVPVVRAAEGPARIAPADPGGEFAQHVGFSVNDVAGTGTAAAAPDQVVLAPEAMGLSDEDLPMGVMGLIANSRPAVDEALVEAASDAPIEVAYTVPATEEDVLTAKAPDAGAPNVVATSVPGVTVSPFPLPHPRRDLAAEAAALAVAAAMGGGSVGGSIDVDPTTLAAGTRLVQLGAFDTPDDAKAEWTRVAARFDALMNGKKRIIQEAASGGRTFYRLRVEGFADVSDARRFCAALQAERTNCIPAQVR